jgi:hypothetical protein
VEAVIPGGEYKRRLGEKGERRLNAADFKHHREGNCYTGSTGKRLECKGTTKYAGGREGKVYQAGAKGRRECPYGSKCVKSKKEGRGRKPPISASNEAGVYA